MSVRNLPEVVAVLSEFLAESPGQLAHWNGIDLAEAVEHIHFRTGLSGKAIYALLRKHPDEVARGLGYIGGEYRPGKYEASGMGPGGCHSARGGASARREPPRFKLRGARA